MITVAPSEVFALLEDGAHTLVELAGWLNLSTEDLSRLLAGPRFTAMGIRACERCSRRFLQKPMTAGRYCTRACYRGDPVPIGLPAVIPAPTSDRPAPSRTLRDDEYDYQVVWNGVGPLPGHGDAPAGLGATLSAAPFFVRKR